MRLAQCIESLKQQFAYNDFQAETYYYMAMAWKALHVSTEARRNFEKALASYEQGYFLPKMSSPFDKIFRRDIEKESWPISGIVKNDSGGRLMPFSIS